MYANQIQQIIQNDPKTKKQFLGVYSANTIPKQMASNSFAIINCCHHSKPGKHWLALYMHGDGFNLEYFDSYGLNPSYYKLQDKLPFSLKLTQSKKQLQSLFSDVCAYYCLLFCFYKVRKYPSNEIITMFTKDFIRNDKYVTFKVKQLYNI